MRQIACPDSCTAAPKADINLDVNFLCLHMPGDWGFVIVWRRRAIFSNQNTAYLYVSFIAISWRTRFSNGHHDTAPIGILASDSGFNQR